MPLSIIDFKGCLEVLWQPFCLVGFVWLAYWDSLKCGYVSDDIQGIAIYDGKLQQPVSWHNLFKKLRFEIGKAPNQNKNWKQAKQPPYQNHPLKHHRFSLIVASGAFVALYALLCRMVGTELAFFATLLFICHPLGCQTLTWISGIGYVVSAFFLALGLNLAFLAYDWGWMASPLGVLMACGLYGFLQWMAIEAQFAAVGAALILAFLGFWPFAVVAGVLSIWGCLHTFREAIVLRTATFKEQQMEQSTKLYFRKIVTVLKTIYYYAKLSLFPKRMGLYHTFGYHYELPYIEHEDKYFWHGVLTVSAIGLGVWLGPTPVKLALLWWLAFQVLFFNWITAHQFVSERYAWLPALGTCVLIAWTCLTLNLLWGYWLLVGVALMRLWSHIPTYENEVRFYLSNLWNFPSSEVAMGNLGVAYNQQNMVGMAFDTWVSGARVNPEYDVNWYNLSSAIRSRGVPPPAQFPVFYNELIPKEVSNECFRTPEKAHLRIAHYCLWRALSAGTCHFPSGWKKELADLESAISQQAMQPRIRFITPVRIPWAHALAEQLKSSGSDVAETSETLHHHP